MKMHKIADRRIAAEIFVISPLRPDILVKPQSRRSIKSKSRLINSSARNLRPFLAANESLTILE